MEAAFFVVFRTGYRIARTEGNRHKGLSDMTGEVVLWWLIFVTYAEIKFTLALVRIYLILSKNISY